MKILKTKGETEEHVVRKQSKFIMAILPYLVIIAVISGIFAFLIEVSYIPSESMNPTLITGDIAIYNRIAYLSGDPQCGDIITFKKDGELYCKRVIGVPGDTLEFDSGYVYVNGEKLDEAYLDENIETNCLRSFTVPKDCYFVLGDNRELSYDSRYWDEPYVSGDMIIARLMVVFPTHILS